jgi:hypothetical protein
MMLRFSSLIESRVKTWLKDGSTMEDFGWKWINVKTFVKAH